MSSKLALVLSARWASLDKGINSLDTFHWTMDKLLPNILLEAIFEERLKDASPFANSIVSPSAPYFLWN